MRQARRLATEHFGDRHPIARIDAKAARAFRQKLLARPLAEATTRKRCGDLKAVLAYAQELGALPPGPNPMDAVPTRAGANAERQVYIEDALARRILEELPDARWRALFALARWGGLRIPSEAAALAWTDVAWQHKTLRITSVKTSRHEGKAERTIPLFPELETALWELYDAAEPGATLCVPWAARATGESLRKPLVAAIRRAGGTPWPRLWQNLRSTRQTELEDHLPTHVVCHWMGNSESIARRHYLQVRPEHFTAAMDPNGALQNPRHNPTQPDPTGAAQPPAMAREGRQGPKQDAIDGLRGTRSASPQGRRETGDSLGTAKAALQNPGQDPQLAALIRAWPRLTRGMRKTIMRLASRRRQAAPPKGRAG
jgi:integrase